MQITSVRDAEVEGKRVLLRTSLNIPVDDRGKLSDDFRLSAGLPTLQYLASKKCKIIITGYFGRAGESLKSVADELVRIAAPIPVRFFGGAVEAAVQEVEKLSGGECLILENMRTYPGEEKNDPAFAASLAALADIFVDDAFAEAHRVYASNVGVAKLLPSYAGLLMEKEIKKLSQALAPGHPALAVIGGAKFETKLPLIKKLATAYDFLLLGGALANDMLKVRGSPVGASLVSSASVPEELAGSETIYIPTDVAVVDSKTNLGRSCPNNDVRATEKIVDVGPVTAAAWAARVGEAQFVVWNGPLGVYEEGYVDATDTVAEALAKSSAHAVVGGGDTLAALSKFKFDEEKIFLSTGGGAMLEFLADGTLPGIEALKS